MKPTHNPTISVIMSVYNSEKYLTEAIESILNQTFKDFEFIIINDGSTDKSLDIIRKYQKKDKRIILINNKKNLGLIKSLNNGLRRSRGKYIARMDSDDISLIKRFQTQYDYLEQNQDIFLVGTGLIQIDENSNDIIKSKPIRGVEFIKQLLEKRNCIAHPTIMFKNKERYFYRNKMLYCEDYDLYLRLLNDEKKIDNIHNILLKYRVTKDSISNSKRSKQDLFVKKAKEFYQQRLKYGKDEYDKFNPQNILVMDIENSLDKFILQSEIKASFKVNDFKRTRTFCKKYFKNHGHLNIILIYYLFSFTGMRNINFLRKILFS